MKRLLSTVLLFTALWIGVVSAETPQQSTVTYTQTDEQFANPERGFYRYLQVDSSLPYVWFTPELTGYRINDDVTLIYCLFVLDTFKNSAISPAFLTTIEDNLDSARDAGLKCILRFAYTYEDTPDNDGDGLFDPPYSDVDKPIILQHLTQLTPIIQANSDIIAVWQAGFIGIYGEWYYTDHFLDIPKQPDQVSAAQWARRYEVLDALLTALPTDRMTQVRYPNAKRQMLPTTAIMPSSEAHSRSNRVLNLPDPETSLQTRPEYSIRLANPSVWESASGFNDLGHTVTVATDATPTGSTVTAAFEGENCTPLAVDQVVIASRYFNYRQLALYPAVLLALTAIVWLVYNRRNNIS